MSKRQKNDWNQGGKSRKNKQTEQERQISELLDRADGQELLQISAIHSNVSMPLPNQEKLAWSVIDKADLVDEEEMERRKKFKRDLRRRKMIHAVIACGVLAVILVVLALCGVFDRINPPSYKTYYIADGECFGGIQPEATLPEKVSVGIPSLADEAYVDQDKLDTTAYYALAEYCNANDYAADEYEIYQYDYCVINGRLCLCCEVVGQCLDYGKEDGGKTWRDLGYTESGGYTGIWGDTGQDRSDEFPIDADAPINMYSVRLKLYVCIE